MGVGSSQLMKIKILFGNVSGLNDGEKTKLIKLVVRPQKADLVCLLKTKVQEMSLQMVRSLGVGRFLNWGAIDARREPRDILIFWDNRVLDLMELECGGSPFQVALEMLKMVLFSCS